MRNGSHPDPVDIIIPVHNHYPCTRALLEGIYRYSDLPFHVFVVDNGSADETVDLDKIYSRDITIVRNRSNRGWAGAINQGIDLGKNPSVVFMQNGVHVAQGWLGNLVAFLESHPRIGAVGPLASSPCTWQCVDSVRRDLVPQIPEFLTSDLHERNHILDHHFHRAGILIEGALAPFCLAVSRRAIQEVGTLDAGAPQEDFCARLRKAGYVLGLALDTYVTLPVKAAKSKSAAKIRKAAKA